jgi:hypothetical protein
MEGIQGHCLLPAPDISVRPRFPWAWLAGEGLPYGPYHDIGFSELMNGMSAAKHRRILVSVFIQQGVCVCVCALGECAARWVADRA